MSETNSTDLAQLKSDLNTLLTHCREVIDKNFVHKTTEGDLAAKEQNAANNAAIRVTNPNVAAFDGFLNHVHNQFERHFHIIEALLEEANARKEVPSEKEKVTPATQHLAMKHSGAFLDSVFNSEAFKPRLDSVYSYTPIGVVRTVFKDLYGIPRQGLLAPHTRARLRLRGDTQPTNSLRGLDGYSHCVLTFVFHRNSNLRFNPLVFPPKLSGKKMGVFSTRSPHRWNNIGLTIAKIDRVEKDTVYLSGVDLVDNTPILDIKPYLHHDSVPDATVPQWVRGSEIKSVITEIVWGEGTYEALQRYCASKTDHLEFYTSPEDAKMAIEECLILDQRTVHMIEKHTDKNYGFCFDTLNIVFRVCEDTEKEKVEGKTFNKVTIESIQSLKELRAEAKK